MTVPRRGIDALISIAGSRFDISAVPEPPAWTVDAVCASTDPEVFFPGKGGATKPAKKVCVGCSVRGECLAYALDHKERFGVWGGLSSIERSKLRKAS